MRLAGVLGLVAMATTVVGLTAAGCGGAETDPVDPPADPLATEAGFCEALAEAVCLPEVVKACYLSDDASLEADTASCVEIASQPSFCNPAGHPYNREGAEDCIAKTEALYDDAELNQAELDNQREACLAVFSAGGAVGASCVVDADCDGAKGLRCVTKFVTTGGGGAGGAGGAGGGGVGGSGVGGGGAGGPDVTVEGTCQIPMQVGPGLDCAAADAVCEDGFYCNESNNCVAEEGIGDACSAGEPCVSEAKCEAGLCVEKASNGESCTSANDCSGGFCLTKAGDTSGQCGSFIPITFDGQICALLTP